MDVQEYIQSGVLEDYCIGLLNEQDEAFLFQMAMLYPEVKAELTATELTFELIAASSAVQPKDGVKSKLLASLGFDDAKSALDINRLPAVDHTTDYENWLDAFSHLIPAEPAEDFIVHVVRNDDQYQQMLVVTKNDVPEEEHENYIESFFILKGNCECTVGTELHQLGPGDFLEIPLHVTHDIKIVSPHVVGILQYRFV